MNSDKFLELREREIRTKIVMEIEAYCNLYDILHGCENADNLKNELSDMMDEALRSFLSDNNN